MAAEAVDVGVVEDISTSTVRRWLHRDAIRPWYHQSWIFPRDPDFATKAGRVLDLYARTWHGEALDDRDYVISADEKTSVQARCRCHPSLPPGLARLMRVNHEYDRGGALAYLVAYDVHRARVFGRCEPATGIVPFSRLVSQVMTQQPYASARNVFWVVDNGSSHRGQKSHRPAEQGVAERHAGPHASPCQLGQPERGAASRSGRATNGRQNQAVLTAIVQ